MPVPPAQQWKEWSIRDVVDADLPAFALRTYLEQADVRSFLQRISATRPIETACEIGCGYGRMTVVLGEFARQVTGFERQPEFVEISRQLHPSFAFHQVDTLDRLPVADHSFDLVLTFTVLQHLTDRSLLPAPEEIKRVVRPGGSVLLCEETNPALRQGDLENEQGMCVIGRSVSSYATWLAPLRLLSTAQRRVEPTYPSKNVGSFMTFQA